MASDAEQAYETLIQFLYRAPVALIQLGADGAIEMLNPMASQLLMPLAPEGDLDNLFTVLQPYAPHLAQLCATFQPTHGVICDGHRVPLRASLSAGNAPAVLSLGLLKIDGGRFMAVLTDVSQEARREQRQLASAARVDSLTQLLNRSGALEQLQRIGRRPRRPEGDFCAVIFINLDRFKQINDSFGSEAGDQVIALVAERLRSKVRANGRAPGPAGISELAARVGGDEFAILMDGLPERAIAERVALRLLSQLSKPYRIGRQVLNCSFSIGVVAPDAAAPASADADDLLRDAALAMAEAKAKGGDQCVLFEPGMRARAMLRGSLESDLRRAIEDGELFAVYQPVVALRADGGIDKSAGVEALVRWRHPLRGLVGPAEFIGIAEESGLIHAIGEHMLELACRDFVRWRQELGPRAPRLLAVNLSRAQLALPGLAAKVAAILAASGMPAASLQLEVTESLAAQGAQVQEQLLAIKALGVKLALDDFGTGYSSLSSLHLLPVDTVKIDRSFISASDTSAHHGVLIEATVKVARSLGMSTVAEGIETPQQAAVALRHGCDKGQGYLFSHPISAEAIRTWLTETAA